MLNTIFLILGVVAGVIYLWFLFTLIFHLIRFGIGNAPKIIALVFFLGSFCLVILVITLFFKISWQNLLDLILPVFKVF
ncbi:hypothetical protein L6252_00560 [Candidatus Parcubacteria bacterium]|nr:hypothetical protein [Candidatus Parcubacteria bacterium]